MFKRRSGWRRWQRRKRREREEVREEGGRIVEVAEPNLTPPSSAAAICSQSAE